MPTLDRLTESNAEDRAHRDRIWRNWTTGAVHCEQARCVLETFSEYLGANQADNSGVQLDKDALL